MLRSFYAISSHTQGEKSEFYYDYRLQYKLIHLKLSHNKRSGEFVDGDLRTTFTRGYVKTADEKNARAESGIKWSIY